MLSVHFLFCKKCDLHSLTDLLQFAFPPPVEMASVNSGHSTYPPISRFSTQVALSVNCTRGEPTVSVTPARVPSSPCFPSWQFPRTHARPQEPGVGGSFWVSTLVPASPPLFLGFLPLCVWSPHKELFYWEVPPPLPNHQFISGFSFPLQRANGYFPFFPVSVQDQDNLTSIL